MFTKQQIDKAIDQEAADWADFFNASDLEGRKSVMRANVAVGYLVPLLPYLDTSVFAFSNSRDGRVMVYGAVIGFPSPSDCVWLIPGTWNVWGLS
jgi:hypothetical protein